jgi:hypothetical protein
MARRPKSRRRLYLYLVGKGQNPAARAAPFYYESLKVETRRIMVREFGHYDPWEWDAHPEWWDWFWATFNTEIEAFAEMNKAG